MFDSHICWLSWLIYWGLLSKDHAVLYDDDGIVMADDYGVFMYIWYDMNGFVLLLGYMAYV